MSEDELALEIVKGRVRDRDTTIAWLRAEVAWANQRIDKLTTLSNAYQSERDDLREEVERLTTILAKVKS